MNLVPRINSASAQIVAYFALKKLLGHVDKLFRM